MIATSRNTAAVAMSASNPLPVLQLPTRAPRSADQRRVAKRVRHGFGVRSMAPGAAVPDLEPRVWQGIDLSFGGMMCRCDEPMWPGNHLVLELLLPDEGRPIPVEGRVVELVGVGGEVGMRVQFEGVSEKSQTRIARWVRDRS